jgi:hypothetical protein
MISLNFLFVKLWDRKITRGLPLLKSVLIAILLFCGSALADEPPTIPVGYDAYRLWDRWPQQRIGVRAYMRSTYDRSGGNEGADASHFLYQTADDFNVSLDLEGQGILYFARYNHWHGSPWHYVVDARDHIIQETSTADPLHPIANSVFLPEAPFPNPLSWTWSQTKGADLMWVPIPFERSFQMAYSRTRYGTGYYIYHQFVEGIPLSQNIISWTTNEVPPKDVLELVSRAGTDIAPEEKTKRGNGSLVLSPKQSITLLTIENAQATVRALQFSVPKEHALEFGRARLRITWDGRAAPSIDAPVALFFGAGTLYNPENREHLVKAFPMNVRFSGEKAHLACYFPMPFFRSARFELLGAEKIIPDIHWSIRAQPSSEAPNRLAYFHATYRDFPHPEPGHDLVLLDTRQTEGGGDWSGQFVGNSWIFSDRAVLNTLEGDPRFFFDDSLTPQAYGTGTEEWGGGGDYWGGLNMTLPFAGHPVGARNEKEARNDEDKIESAYRFLLADLFPFGRNALIRLEHGGENLSTEHYQAVTYWYGFPAASLIKTDELQIGDPTSESKHQYHSPDASAPYEITSRYEWGVDHLQGREIYPAHTDKARKTTGSSQFLLNLNPSNLGVLLRRKLDYQYPNQRAEVFVAASAETSPSWKKAGVWYLAGGNTCIYSNPKDELGATEHHIQTSNRRFRDDEFLVPRNLTEGKSAIRIKIQFTPVRHPLFPGHPVPELAWTEIKYTAYSFVLPPTLGSFSTRQ